MRTLAATYPRGVNSMASDRTFWQWIGQREEAKARLTATRRAAEGRWSRGNGGGWSSHRARSIRSAQSALPYEVVTLRVLTQTGPFIAGPVKFHAPEFQEQFGGVIEVIEAPNTDLFARAQQVAQTGSGD